MTTREGSARRCASGRRTGGGHAGSLWCAAPRYWPAASVWAGKPGDSGAIDAASRGYTRADFRPMANILYGVNGEGAGHSTRSREVLAHLRRSGHTLHVVSFDRGLKNLGSE